MGGLRKRDVESACSVKEKKKERERERERAIM